MVIFLFCEGHACVLVGISGILQVFNVKALRFGGDEQGRMMNETGTPLGLDISLLGDKLLLITNELKECPAGSERRPSLLLAQVMLGAQLKHTVDHMIDPIQYPFTTIEIKYDEPREIWKVLDGVRWWSFDAKNLIEAWLKPFQDEGFFRNIYVNVGWWEERCVRITVLPDNPAT